MSDNDTQVPLQDLNAADSPGLSDVGFHEEEDQGTRVAGDLEAVFDVPVQVSAVLGRRSQQIGSRSDHRQRFGHRPVVGLGRQRINT